MITKLEIRAGRDVLSLESEYEYNEDEKKYLTIRRTYRFNDNEVIDEVAAGILADWVGTGRDIEFIS